MGKFINDEEELIVDKEDINETYKNCIKQLFFDEIEDPSTFPQYIKKTSWDTFRIHQTS